MKNITLLLLGVIVVLGSVLLYLKPVEASKQPSSITTENPTSPELQPQMTSTDSQKILTEGEKPYSDSASSEVELIDTKSDLSIQPIDPEIDPGNQILKNN